MSTVSLISGLSAQATGAITTEANGKLGKQDFLNLLLTQMKYQDPLDPMDDTAMIAQMAQFSSLEQLLSLNESFSGLQSVAMLGRTVKAYTADGGVLEGKVESVDMSQVIPALKLEGNVLVAMKDIFEVTY